MGKMKEIKTIIEEKWKEPKRTAMLLNFQRWVHGEEQLNDELKEIVTSLMKGGEK